MSFHKKALITFAIFHIFVTLGGVLADKLQTHLEPTNDRDMIAQGVGLYVYVLFTLLMSLIGLGVAYSVQCTAKLIGRLHKKKQARVMSKIF
ncbi:hypothetical protein [Limnohabitans sp. B9-3]|uniref:hypothetical protein n=1 Tax=Limnohabitans sp. B9-3 TaxID=1100707 RepID=UPI000C1E88CA|nr:hypothetical protein [Limnohabitans sp. B9-3]PIT71368.1 hypothetical protein B9Z42_15630 [Limnohabitans sp. B9-3]